MNVSRVLRLYFMVGTVLLTTAVLLVLVNVTLWSGLRIRDRASGGESDPPWLDAHTQLVYRDWTPAEIARIRAETRLPHQFEPYMMFRDRARVGEFVNVSEHGFRISRDQAPWPPIPSNFNVFVFGGSTVFGWMLPDNETIPSHLQQGLRQYTDRPIAVYNFGRAYYQSTQERILLQQLLVKGLRPAAAIFVDGVNDAYLVNGEPAFSNEFSAFVDRRVPSPLRNLALYRSAARLRSWLATRGAARDADGTSRPRSLEARIAQADTVISRYLDNRRMIDAIGREFGVPTLFVWQPVPNYRYDPAYHPFAAIASWRIANYPTIYSRFEERLGIGTTEALSTDPHFAWCAAIQEEFKEPLYVDPVHYSPKLSRMVADCVVRGAVRAGLLTEPRPNAR